jgi:hypothetical protein
VADVIAPQLAPDERELRRAAGRARFPRRKRGADVFRGEVLLTDQRLMFAPVRNAAPSMGLELVLGDIVELRPWRASAWPWAAHGVEVLTRLGHEAAVQLLVRDHDRWCDAIGAARSEFRGRTDLSGWLLQADNTGGPSPAVLRALERTLVDERAFPGGFWHPEDEHGLAAILRESGADLGLPIELFDDAFVAGLVERHGGRTDYDVDEEALRQRQLREIAAAVNAALTERGDPRRMHTFAPDLPGLEAEDHAFWAVCTDREARKLLGLGIVRENHPAKR